MMLYGLILWENSTNRNKLSKIQMKIIRIMAGVKKCLLYKLFRQFNIPSFASEFVLWLLSFVVENLRNFEEIQMFTVKTLDVDMSFICQILT
jgi:hypothetical protein